MNWIKRLFSKAKQPAFHAVTIQCPECGMIQQAKVEHTNFWNIYVHDCTKCGYTIMESEWNTVYFCDIHHIWYEAGNVCGQCLSEGDRG
jgi:predicted RNA-binding Zn-ribbon protein involved in translation (DUF1610 family)